MKDVQGWLNPRRIQRGSWAATASKVMLYATAALSLIVVPVRALAGELPDDVWSGKYGGLPSVTVDAKGNVSMEVPAGAVEKAGGGSVADLAKDFLEKWASNTCFSVFDFQSPHKNLRVQVALLQSPAKAGTDHFPQAFYEASDYIDVVVDYDPRNTTKCSAAPGT